MERLKPFDLLRRLLGGERPIMQDLILGLRWMKPVQQLQLRFSDHTREDVRFNLHHTVADIRKYFDASSPQENEVYILLVVLPLSLCRELCNPDETIQQVGLDFSITEQRRY